MLTLDESREAPLGSGSGHKIGIVAALSDPLFCEAIRMRLESEPGVVVVGIVHQLAGAIDAARDPRADVLILGSALLANISDETLGELQNVSAMVKLVLVSAPSDTTSRRWASTMRAVEVVSQLESPDRLLAATRSITP